MRAEQACYIDDLIGYHAGVAPHAHRHVEGAKHLCDLVLHNVFREVERDTRITNLISWLSSSGGCDMAGVVILYYWWIAQRLISRKCTVRGTPHD